MDSGSDDVILPSSAYPKEHLHLLSKCKTTIRGIAATPVIPDGEFFCNLDIGQSTFKNIRVMVVDREIPVLVGNTVLKHPSVIEYTINNQAGTLTFLRQFANNTATETAPLVNRHSTFVSQHHLPQSLDDKVKWLTEHKGVSLPETHRNRHELETIADMLIEFEEVLDNGTGECKIGTFPESVSIPTNGQSKAIKQHPIPEAYIEGVNKNIATMFEQGVIEECPQPKGFNSPIHVVPKKNGELRIVVNFKHTLNKLLSTEADYAWQMPSTDSTFNQIGRGNKYFSSIDLKSGYWQIPVMESERYKTAFQWQNRTYQFARLPFGLTIAGQIFSRCISTALSEVSNHRNLKTYIDDVLVHSKHFDDYASTLRQVLEAMKKFDLRLNAKKCSFLCSSAKFLGRIIDTNGFSPDPGHVKDILDMKAPTTRAELQTAIGNMLWLRHFVEVRVGECVRTSAFSHLIYHMNRLNRKNEKFEWTKEAEQAFQTVKRRLSSPPAVQFADFNRPFVLVTDASEVAAGAVLMQQIDGKEAIVAVASTTFNTTEQRWCATEREAYAIVWAVQKFDYFLRGRKFLVKTDHKSLIYLDRTNFNNSKIARWQDKLSEYQFCVEYIEGHTNVFADLLSRPCGLKKTKAPDTWKPAGKYMEIGKSGLKVYIPSWCNDPTGDLRLTKCDSNVNIAKCFSSRITEPDEVRKEVLDMVEYAEAQRKDDYLQKVIAILESKGSLREKLDSKDHRTFVFKQHADHFFLEPITGALMYRRDESGVKTVVPEAMRPHILYRAHDGNGHFGSHRMGEAIRNFWWPKKNDDMNHYVNSCIHCAMRKGTYGRNVKPPIGHLQRGSRPFECLYIDFVHMPAGICGKKYIVTILDSFSRYLFAVPTCRDRAIDAVHALLNKVVYQYDEIPAVLSSDRGTHFTSSVTEEFCKKLGIKQQLHVSWRPQSSGNIERAHRTLKNALYATASEKNVDWVEALPSVVNAMNNAPNRSTGVSPRMVVFGERSRHMLPEIPGEKMRSETPLSFALNRQLLRSKVHEIVKTAAKAADSVMERRMNGSRDPEDLKVGGKVFLYRPQSARAKATKLPWIGPFTVLETNQQVTLVQDDNGEKDWVHREHLRKFEDRKPELEPFKDRIPLVPITFHSDGILPQRSSNESPAEPITTSKPKTGGRRVELSVPSSSVKPDVTEKYVAPERRSTRTRRQHVPMVIIHDKTTKGYG